MYKILVVEDEAEISSVVEKYLSKAGYEPIMACNGIEALEKFSNNHIHLVLLDVMMPGIDGFEVLSRIRHISDVPVIMVTARESELDRLKGFDIGVDDYVLKPFSPRELLSRVKVFLKRVYDISDEPVLVSGDLKLFTGSMKLLKRDKEIELTSAEFDLLHTFMRHQGQILTREQLIELSFGSEYDGIDRNIDTYIKRVRKKIEDNPRQPDYLKTKYGKGYVFGGDYK